MKKLLLFLLLTALVLQGLAQTRITDMPTYTGDASNAWVPVVIGGVNRKTLGKNLAYSKVDSVRVIGYDIYWYTGGTGHLAGTLSGGGTDSSGATLYYAGWGLHLSAGTFSVDTLLVATRGYVNHLRDSLGAVKQNKLTTGDTTQYIRGNLSLGNFAAAVNSALSTAGIMHYTDTVNLSDRINAITTSGSVGLIFNNGLEKIGGEVHAKYLDPIWDANRIQTFYVEQDQPHDREYLGFDSSYGVIRWMPIDSAGSGGGGGGSFTLTNGSGTTANGTAVDLGGTLSTDVYIDMTNSHSLQITGPDPLGGWHSFDLLVYNSDWTYDGYDGSVSQQYLGFAYTRTQSKVMGSGHEQNAIILTGDVTGDAQTAGIDLSVSDGTSSPPTHTIKLRSDRISFINANNTDLGIYAPGLPSDSSQAYLVYYNNSTGQLYYGHKPAGSSGGGGGGGIPTLQQVVTAGNSTYGNIHANQYMISDSTSGDNTLTITTSNWMGNPAYNSGSINFKVAASSNIITLGTPFNIGSNISVSLPSHAGILTVQGDVLGYTPTSSTDASYDAGTFCADDTYVYFRTSSGTWKKIAWGPF